MGIITQGKSLWNALFTRTQRQVLSLMFGYPDRSFFANEVVRLAGVGTGSVQRELARLSACGLLTVKRIGNQKHYQANPANPIFPELRSMVMKTFGAMDQLRNALMELDQDIRLALVYGPEVHEVGVNRNEIHMLIVSDRLDYAGLISGLTEVENRIGRSIQPLLLTGAEFDELRKGENEAVRDILRQPRVLLTGSVD